MSRMAEATTFAQRKALADEYMKSLPPDPLRGLVCIGIQEQERQDRPGTAGQVVEVIEVEVWGRKGRKMPSCFRYPDGRIEWMPGEDPDLPKVKSRPDMKPIKVPRRIPSFGRLGR